MQLIRRTIDTIFHLVSMVEHDCTEYSDENQTVKTKKSAIVVPRKP